MRHQPLPPKFHATNRARLAEAIGPEAIAIIDTADTLVRTGDFTYPYRPDSNFYYLTGIAEPEAVLALVPGSSSEPLRELLFIRETNDFIAQWEGARHTQAEATERSGIQSVFWLSDLERMLDRILAKYFSVYLNADESHESHMPHPAKRRAALMQDKFPLHILRSAIPQLTKQRLVKDPVEVDQIRRAITITGVGLSRAWSALGPDVPEYVLEAELGAGFLREGADGHAFMPIVASGSNATIIHYMTNNGTVGGDELVLFDVGAESGWYAADISRTVPANGQFTPRQRAVYEAVWRTQQAAIGLHKPGASILSIDEHMQDLLTQELVGLEVFTPAQAKSKDKYRLLQSHYSHISHHLGLDVHDLGDARTVFEPGMVVTCEPGLYLKEEGIGVRLEDDILITKDGHEVLSRNIPSDPESLVRHAPKGRAA